MRLFFLKNRSFVLMVLGSFLLITACQKSPGKVSEKVLVRVNGEPITYEQVDRRLRSIHGDVDLEKADPVSAQRMTEQAIDAEIMDTLLLQSAEEMGIHVDEERIDGELELTVQMMGESGFKEMLAKRQAGEGEYREFVKNRLTIAAFREKLFEEITVSEDILEEYYEGHSKGVQSPAAVRLHILLGKEKDTADTLHMRAVSGEEFNVLAGEFEMDGGTVSRTRWIPYDSVPVKIGALVKNAGVGDVIRYSGPAGEEYVIKVLEKREERAVSFEEIRDQVRNDLIQTKRQNALDNWYEAQLKTARIEYLKDSE